MEEFYLDINCNISVVVPVFNAEKSIEELFDRLKTTLQGLEKSFEVIFVDDFSKDKSWVLIEKLKKENNDLIKGIKLSKNYGQHNATLCGIKHALGEFIITIDDDLEFLPEDIPLLINEQEKTKVDLVYGVGPSKKSSLIRKLSRFLYTKIAKINHDDFRPNGSSFRLIKKALAKKILVHQRNFSFVDEFLLWYTSDILSVRIECKKSVNKKSRYTGWGLFILIRDLALLSSIAPLRLLSFIGSLMISVNFIYGSFLIYKKVIMSISVEGYTSLIVTILFSTGIIMFSIGVVAEYLSKLIKVSYNQPAFIEKHII